MSDLQRVVLADILLHGPSKAADIAARIGRKTRAVINALCYLRGNGWVTDGATCIGAGLGFAWEPGPKPSVWEVMFEPLPGMVVFHGHAIPRVPW